MFCLCGVLTIVSALLVGSVVGHSESESRLISGQIHGRKAAFDKVVDNLVKSVAKGNESAKINEAKTDKRHVPFEKTTELVQEHVEESLQIRTWIYAATSVFAISIISLFSILFIPLIKQDPNGDFIQMLIGLAIGTLASDALIHLLPHALSHKETVHHDHIENEIDDHHEHHNKSALTGLIAMTGLVIFLAFKRFFSAISSESRPNNNSTELDENENNQKLVDDDFPKNIYLNNNIDSNVPKVFRISYENVHNQRHDHFHHHHTHGHSSTIFTVITGDGLHNFCDGLAIGVAFVSGFNLGLSTSIAILCHELPHEIGDFAVLIKAGLPVKTAIKYNVVSSILAFIGLAIGILLGNVFDGKLNAIIAGTFLHIALVDIVPQLETDPRLSKARTLKIVIIQFMGIFIGTAIMYFVAIFE